MLTHSCLQLRSTNSFLSFGRLKFCEVLQVHSRIATMTNKSLAMDLTTDGDGTQENPIMVVDDEPMIQSLVEG